MIAKYYPKDLKIYGVLPEFQKLITLSGIIRQNKCARLSMHQ